MNKMNRYLMTTLFATSLLLGGSSAFAANGEAMYKFLPSDTVVDNVKNTLQSHGIDVSALQVDADAQGVVQLKGEVASKQEVENITQIAKQADGVYAILGAMRYETGDVVPVSSPEALGNTMEAPAAGTEAPAAAADTQPPQMDAQ